MTLSTPTGYVRAQHNITLANGSVGNNVVHYHYDFGVTVPSSQQMAFAFEDMISSRSAAIAAPRTNGSSFASSDLYVWNTTTNTFDTIGTANHSVVGASVAKSSPSQIAGLCTLGVSDPKRNGSIYVPAVSDGQLDSLGDFSAGGLINLAGYGDALTAPFTSSNGMTLTAVVFSKQLLSFLDILSLTVTTTVATQRRRTRGRGS